MNLLLDAHTYIWWLAGDRRLGARAKEAIGRPSSTVYVSAAVVWEISIKAALGRLKVHEDILAEIAANQFVGLPITAAHARAAANLPPHHQDPFDRVLVAQAIAEDLVCVSRDAQLAAYGLQLLW